MFSGDGTTSRLLGSVRIASARGRRAAVESRHAHFADLKQKFAAIYATDYWSNGSVPGSTEVLTNDYRVYVQEFLWRH